MAKRKPPRTYIVTTGGTPKRYTAPTPGEHEKAPPVHIPHAKKSPPAPLPPATFADPIATLPVRAEPRRTRKPPPAAPPPRAEPRSRAVETPGLTVPGHPDMRLKPFKKGDKPTGMVMTGHGLAPYWKVGPAGPEADKETRLNAADIAALEAQQPGGQKFLEETARAIVPFGNTLRAAGAGRPFRSQAVLADVGNLILNLPGTGAAHAAAVPLVALRSSKVARAFHASLREGEGLKAAITAAAATRATAKLAPIPRAVERDLRPLLLKSPSRKEIFAEIDRQAPSMKAARLKAQLDHAAMEYAEEVANGMPAELPIRTRRQVRATEWYDHQLARATGGTERPHLDFQYGPTLEEQQLNWKRFTTEKNVGARKPESVPHASTHPDVEGIQVIGEASDDLWWQRVQHAVGHDPELGLKLAFWYREFAPLLQAYFPEDYLPIIHGFAASQANASPAGGLAAVLHILHKIKAGEPVGPNEASVVSSSIQAAIRGEPVTEGMAAKLTEFTDAMLGKRTRTWVGNDPALGMVGPIDVHMQRDWGQVDAKILSTLRDRHGLPVEHLQLEVLERELTRRAGSKSDRVKVGQNRYLPKSEAIREQKAKIQAFREENGPAIEQGLRSGIVLDNPSGAATGLTYDDALRVYQRRADYLREIKAWDYEDWTPAEAQALGWSAIQRIHGVVPEDATVALNRNTHLISFETLNGRNGFAPAPESYKEALALTRSAEDRVRRIASEEGAIWRDIMYGPGSGEGDITPSAHLSVFAPPEVADRVAQRLADEFQQWATLAIRPGVTGTKSRAAIELEGPMFSSRITLERFWRIVQRDAAEGTKFQRENLKGFSPMVYRDADGVQRHGIRILTGHGSTKLSDGAAVNRVLDRYRGLFAGALRELGMEDEVLQLGLNNVEVRSFKGADRPASAVPAGTSGESAADRAAAEDVGYPADPAEDPDEVDPLFDGVTALAEQRSSASTESWQQGIRDFIAAEQGELRLGRPERGLDVPYEPRLLQANELSAQVLRPRSTLSYNATKMIDAASKGLDETFVANWPGVRNVTMTRRAFKAAGRMQRQENARRYARMASSIRTLEKVREGSAKDVAHFWYAQLPGGHRNEEGLRLVRNRQLQELEKISSGEAREEIEAARGALRAQLADAETAGDAYRLMNELADLDVYEKNLPFDHENLLASIGQLNKLIARPVEYDPEVLSAMRALSEDRERILDEAGRDVESMQDRKHRVTEWLGLEPEAYFTDEAPIYIGHRLPPPERPFFNGGATIGGTGRVSLPQGVSQQNRMFLASRARLRQSTRVSYDDWDQAQVFEQANRSRDDLGAGGTPFPGGDLPKDYVLVNPKGRTIPKHWKSDELSQFTDDAADADEIRELAKDVQHGYYAEQPEDVEEMVRLKLEAGESWKELRMVPRDHVKRYYSQFRSFKKQPGALKAYDMAVDAVATSIIFFRAGYIPKNTVQNLIMALPHQGAFFPINAVRAGQVLRDPELRNLIKGEVHSSAATAALGSEMTVRGVTSKVTNWVTSVADDPARISAFLHEAAVAGVISKTNPLLTATDRKNLLRLFREKRQRPLLNDIHWRGTEAMADFTRLTPDQAKAARRFLIIPGWLMAGSRYPFHFALTHPIRSVLLAYIATGELGAPEELQFNKPVTQYFHGKKWLRGIDTRWGRIRTASLNPVSTPYELGTDIVGSARGKTGPFDYDTPTVMDVASPLVTTADQILHGEADWARLGKRLAPSAVFAQQIVDPQESDTYPEDATRWGRLKRELGIVPIEINDPGGGGGPLHMGEEEGPPGSGGGGGGLGDLPGLEETFGEGAP